MSDCPFCERVEHGDYEDTDLSHIVTFEPLNPVTSGHRLFVPGIQGQHFTHSHEWAAALVADTMKAAEDYALRQGEDFNLIISRGTSATQTIEHLHVHYVPRREGDGLHLPWTGQREGDNQ